MANTAVGFRTGYSYSYGSGYQSPMSSFTNANGNTATGSPHGNGDNGMMSQNGNGYQSNQQMIVPLADDGSMPDLVWRRMFRFLFISSHISYLVVDAVRMVRHRTRNRESSREIV